MGRVAHKPQPARLGRGAWAVLPLAPPIVARGAHWHVERLVERSANLKEQSKSGELPLDLAKKKGYQETISLLQKI